MDMSKRYFLRPLHLLLVYFLNILGARRLNNNEKFSSKTAKAIIAILFRDYWATDEQKAKIIANQNNNRKKLENKTEVSDAN